MELSQIQILFRIWRVYRVRNTVYVMKIFQAKVFCERIWSQPSRRYNSIYVALVANTPHFVNDLPSDGPKPKYCATANSIACRQRMLEINQNLLQVLMVFRRPINIPSFL